MTTLDISVDEKWLLRSALRRHHAAVSRSRGFSERNLADGVPDFDVVTRLARDEELELATIDGLLTKLWTP